jgi:hypothetical protein
MPPAPVSCSHIQLSLAKRHRWRKEGTGWGRSPQLLGAVLGIRGGPRAEIAVVVLVEDVRQLERVVVIGLGTTLPAQVLTRAVKVVLIEQMLTGLDRLAGGEAISSRP